MQNPKLFGKFTYENVEVPDDALKDHIAIKQSAAQVYTAHTAGRWQKKQFHKIKCPLAERLVAALMFHGRNNGKKLMCVRHVEQTLDLIALSTGENPLQILVKAVCNCGPREDSCRVGSAGVVRLQAVDVSPMRRVNKALYMMAKGVRDSTFRNIKTLPECLADEIIAAAHNNPNSFAIKKKQEVERAAQANR